MEKVKTAIEPTVIKFITALRENGWDLSELILMSKPQLRDLYEEEIEKKQVINITEVLPNGSIKKTTILSKAAA